MALWGKTDTLASAPKWVVKKALFAAGAGHVDTTANTINLIDSNTSFATGDAVVYNNGGGTTITGLTNGSIYYARVVDASLITLYDTKAHALDTANTTGILDISGAGTGTQSLQKTVEGNTNNHTFQGDVYFVDVQEAQQAENRARGLKNPGWWLYSTGTNADSSVWQHSECLVALGGQDDKLQATTGDSSDDTVLVDGTITIDTQPLSQSKVAGSGAGNKGVFTVAATLAGLGTLGYQWQIQQSTESGTTWNNVSTGTGGTTATYTTGTTQVAAGAADSNGDKYRCVVSATTGGVTVRSVASSTAVLTVTAS
jgi:hypothetical protein